MSRNSYQREKNIYIEQDMFVSDTFYPIVCGNSEVETKFHILLCISLENGVKEYINIVVFKFFSQTCKQENIRMRKT